MSINKSIIIILLCISSVTMGINIVGNLCEISGFPRLCKGFNDCYNNSNINIFLGYCTDMPVGEEMNVNVTTYGILFSDQYMCWKPIFNSILNCNTTSSCITDICYLFNNTNFDTKMNNF